MRFRMRKARNSSWLIDQLAEYNLKSLEQALFFLQSQYKKKKKVIVLGDFSSPLEEDSKLYRKVANLFVRYPVYQVIAIGNKITKYHSFFSLSSKFYHNHQAFFSDFSSCCVEQSVFLVQGEKNFTFPLIEFLEEKKHQTKLEVDLDAICHNLNSYRSCLNSQTKTMVMIKAFAYGNGILEVAQALEQENVDYLAVAYVDEGVFLREQGIELPIMVMNPDPQCFSQMQEFQLEPEVYSLRVLKKLSAYCQKNNWPADIHIKLDTGMHRLGFGQDDLESIVVILKSNSLLRVVSVFSHLVGAEEDIHDSFSAKQIEKFVLWGSFLEKSLGYSLIKHLINTGGIVRHLKAQFDMVRLGIGLYGVDIVPEESPQVLCVTTLKTWISQIKKVRVGETIGYSRRGVAEKDLLVATISIGYGDGFDRRFGNGKGKVWINQQEAPVVGNVCMDMTMVDVTNLDVEEGQEVVIFGPNIFLTTLAEQIGTIPYEILTGINERVKRVFFYSLKDSALINMGEQ